MRNTDLDFPDLENFKEKQKVPHSYSRAEENARFGDGVRDDDLLIKGGQCIFHAVQAVQIARAFTLTFVHKHVCSTKDPAIRPNDETRLFSELWFEVGEIASVAFSEIALQ